MSDTLVDDRGRGGVVEPVVTRSMRAIGTTAVIAVTDGARVDEGLALLAEDLRSLDAACSRFCPDSELRRLEATGGGHPSAVSSLLFDALDVARAVALQTAGIVDPTIGSALIELGYDRDFDAMDPDGRQVELGVPRPAPGWWHIELDPVARTVMIPAGIHVDLGATAKAWAADRSAQRIAEALDCGVLVNLGGDVAVDGPAPVDGWPVGIAAECTTPVAETDCVVSLLAGGLATSGTTARSWMRGGRRVHHIIDPWTGEPAPSIWKLVSTTASSCVEANAWSTAAVVWGDDAVGNLSGFGVPARLVDAEGEVVHVGDWPVGTDARPGRPEGPGLGVVR